MFDNQIVSTTQNSPSTNVQQLDQASIDLRWSASTLVANVVVQAKNGQYADWRDIDFGSPITISGSSGAHEVLFLAMPFTDLRLRVVVVSGSGTVDAVITAKTVGA
jgi:hypothetical protein